MLVCLYSHNCSSCDNLLVIIRFHVSYGSGTPCCLEMCNLSAVILPVITFQRYPILTTSVQTRCSALIANVWLNKIKACLRVFWGTKAICAVQGGVTDPSHSADTIGLNKKKQIVAILYQLCYGLSEKCNWFECDDAVVLNDYHLNQQGFVLSIS